MTGTTRQIGRNCTFDLEINKAITIMHQWIID